MNGQARKSPPLVEVKQLTKRFPLVTANKEVDFEIYPGEIHCLLGENGAGKTTLAECMYGFYSPDEGKILYRGEPVSLNSPNDAIQLGIGMVHQHFMLVEPHSVLENIILGTQQDHFFLNLHQAEQKVRNLCEQYQVCLDLEAKIWQLSVGEQQWVEILKALYVGVDLLILDEPTAVLTPQESEHLFSVLKQMKEEGLAIIFITHKLKEVISVSDRVTILRKGERVGTLPTNQTSREELARLMVGRKVLFDVQKEKMEAGSPLLSIRGLIADNDMGQQALQGVDLMVHQGEILGIAGVAGNGQKELMETLIGVREVKEGSIIIDGRDISSLPPRKILKFGVGHIPSDRVKYGVVGDFSISENLILGNEWDEPYRKGLVLNEKAIQELAEKSIASFNISTPSPEHKARYLSGGNLQKVILAREFGNCPKVLLADQPCRGLDVGVIEYVHRQLLNLRSEGVALLLISEDLDEIFTLSDRVAVIFQGQIVGEFPVEDAEREKVGLLMAGVTEERKG